MGEEGRRRRRRRRRRRKGKIIWQKSVRAKRM
jgi:hypothetical protein